MKALNICFRKMQRKSLIFPMEKLKTQWGFNEQSLQLPLNFVTLPGTLQQVGQE